MRLHSRRGHDWTKRLETIAAALQGIACRSAIIDAELVLPDSAGRPDFYGLHRGWRSLRLAQMRWSPELRAALALNKQMVQLVQGFCGLTVGRRVASDPPPGAYRHTEQYNS